MSLRSAMTIVSLVLLMTNGGDTGWTVAGPPLAQANAIVAAEEELEYEVSWTFISLGTIRLHGKPEDPFHTFLEMAQIDFTFSTLMKSSRSQSFGAAETRANVSLVT